MPPFVGEPGVAMVPWVVHPMLRPTTAAARSATSSVGLRRERGRSRPSRSVLRVTPASVISVAVFPGMAGRASFAVGAVVVIERTEVPAIVIAAGVKLQVIPVPAGG